MQRSTMDMALTILAEVRHGIDHHGKTEVVALAIEDDIHRCDSNWLIPKVWPWSWRAATHQDEIAT